MSELALRLIAENKKTKNPILDLGNCGLTEFPMEVLECTHLEELNFKTNYWDGEGGNENYSSNEGQPNLITIIPDLKELSYLKKLRLGGSKDAKTGEYKENSFWALQSLDFVKYTPALQVLDISFCKVASLAPLKLLNNLSELDFSFNYVSDLEPLKQLDYLSDLDFNWNLVSDLGPLQKLQQLTKLDFSSNLVSDLAPLQKLQQLTKLDFSSNQVSDLAPLQKLQQLTELYFRYNKVTDLGPLHQLKQLTKLDFSSNKVSDLGPLQKLKQLTKLGFTFNQVSDLAPLQKLQQLTSLDFSSNQVSDLAPLQQLTKLTSLYFSSNQVSDLGPLQKLTKLTSLYFSSNQVSDLGPLQLLSKLTELDFCENQVSELQPLQQVYQLSKLYFNNNQVFDIGPLQQLTNLTELWFHYNQVSDLGPLQLLDQLTKLYFRDNQVSDLGPLQQLTKLTSLNFWNNQVSDLGPLQQLIHLNALIFGKNQVSDLGPLQQLTRLTKLDFTSNQVSDLGHLQHLKQLTSLFFSYNQVSDLAPLQHLKQLTELSISDNQVSDLAPLQQLQQLTELDFRSNQVSDLAQIKDLFIDGKLRVFAGKDNPLINPPIEVVNQGVDAIRRYFEQAQKWGEVNCSDIKLIFIGNSTSGKTTLANMLVHEVFEEVPSTHGILNQFWVLEATDDHEEIKATIWDFGGQEYYHATHRMFLSPNSIYILVTSKESEFDGERNILLAIDKEDSSGNIQTKEMDVMLQQHTYPYWLNTIQYYLQRFPNKQDVFLVETKTERPAVTIEQNEQLYPQLSFLADPSRIDSAKAFAQKEKNGTAYIQFWGWKSTMKDHIREKLKGYKIISVFPVIRDALAQVASTMTSEQSPEQLNKLCRTLNIKPPNEWPVLAPWITFEEYETFIRQYFFKGDPNEDINNLTLYLQHSCSRVLHFDHIGLNGKICIDPIWLHKHIYHVLSPEIKEADGLFDFEHVDHKVPGDAITAEEMVDIMKAYRLIFELPEKNDKGQRQFIAPQYLPKALSQEKQIVYNTMMRFKFEPAFYIQFNHLLPSAVISQFTSSVGYRANHDLLWKQGVVFERYFSGNKENIIVQANAEKRELEIWLEQKSNPIVKTVIIEDIVEQIVNQNNEQESSILLRLPDHEPIRYSEVKAWVDDRKIHHNTLCEQYEKYVNHDKVLKVFVSYAHAQSDAFKYLVNELKDKWFKIIPIEIKVISDLDITLNARWHEFIQYELNRCDFFIGCLSQDYVISSYINEYEIKTIQQHLNTKALELCFINMSGHLADHEKFYFEHQRFQPTYRDLGHPTDKPNQVVFFEEIYENEKLLRSYLTRLIDKLKPAIERAIERKVGKNNPLN